MNLPTVKTLMGIKGIDSVTARKVRRVLEQGRPFDDGRGISSTLAKCSELINGHGVEYIRHTWDGMYRVWGVEYVNLGDTYDCTLLFDHARERFYVCSWGAIVEAQGAKYN